MMKKISVGNIIFDTFNYIFLFVVAVVSVFPFIYILGGSFASENELLTRKVFLIPHEISFSAYQYVFSSNTLLRGILVSVYVTVVGTLINLFFTTTMAYPLARRNLKGRNVILNLIIFSMFFGGGMIPTYLVVKGLGMINTYWSLVFPGAISAFNLIVVKNFFQQLPDELEESARIDGCTDIGVFVKIVLPLSIPVLATFGLFYAVGNWNSFFNALIYINDASKWPLQIILRQLVLLSQGTIGDMSQLDTTFVKPPEESVKMAVIIVGTVPILMIYPFLQKHFAKGVMIGAIKG